MNKLDKLKDEVSDYRSDFKPTPPSAQISGRALVVTVILVLITCGSGYLLTESAFTAVVGLSAPVVVALLGVIRDTSIAAPVDTQVQMRQDERDERLETARLSAELEAKKVATEQAVKLADITERARQFDAQQVSQKDLLDLINKDKSTELEIGSTKIKLSDSGTSISTDK